MKKKDFISLVAGVAGCLVFGMGLCMCLIPEWNAFKPGVAVTAVGLVALAVLAVSRWMAAGRPGVHVEAKLLGKILLGTAGALVLGVGMCMVMVWQMFIPGILVGIAGIVLLLCLIPAVVGLK